MLLFDEIEKAHPDVFDILLQILEDGRLTGGQGRTVVFRNTVIIMTSNLGTEGMRRQPFGFRTDDKEVQDDMRDLTNSVDTALKRAFRPEFLNRIDDTIVFHPLKQDEIVQIVSLIVRDVQNRIGEREITFELTADAEFWLAREGSTRSMARAPCAGPSNGNWRTRWPGWCCRVRRSREPTLLWRPGRMA